MPTDTGAGDMRRQTFGNLVAEPEDGNRRLIGATAEDEFAVTVGGFHAVGFQANVGTLVEVGIGIEGAGTDDDRAGLGSIPDDGEDGERGE